MFLTFLFGTNQNTFITLISVCMSLRLLNGTYQIALLTNKASFTMLMNMNGICTGNTVAFITMSMGMMLFKGANQIVIGIIAILIMGMNDIIGFCANKLTCAVITIATVIVDSNGFRCTGQNIVFIPLVAFFGMFVFLKTTEGLPFHCNGRKNQSISSTEYHNATHNTNKVF